MADPLSILGATASSLQIAALICQLGNRILTERPKDKKLLKELSCHAKRYVNHLIQSEGGMDGEGALASKELRQVLEAIVADIDGLKNRTGTRKLATALKLYSPDFEQRMAKGLDEFKLRMCIEGRRRSLAGDERLEAMNQRMERLQITAETLTDFPETKSVIESVHRELERVSEDIRGIKRALERLKTGIQDLSNTTNLSQLEFIVEKDGNTTRERITEAAHTILGKLELNDSLCRISAEFLPFPERVIWYDHNNDLRPKFKLWTLDKLNEGESPSQPAAELNGIEFSAASSTDTIDDIFEKRLVADELDRSIARLKRRRSKDVSPYVGITKRDNYIQVLQEYMPHNLVQKLSKLLPKEVLVEALRITRTLGQEYRYYLLDRIITSQYSTLPKLAMFEEMERAMLALHAEKVNVSFGFYLEPVHDCSFRFDINVNISSSGYEIQVSEPPFDRSMLPIQLLEYHKARGSVFHQTTHKFISKGSIGLGTILKACLSIYNEEGRGHLDIIKLFESLFTEQVVGRDDLAYHGAGLLEGELAFFTESDLAIAGSARLHKCNIETPLATLRFAGVDLFNNYWISLARGSYMSQGRNEETINLLQKGLEEESKDEKYWRSLIIASIAMESPEMALQAYKKFQTLGYRLSPDDAIFVSIGQAFQDSGDYEGAIRAYEIFVHDYPKMFDLWGWLGEVYFITGDYQSAIKSLKIAITIPKPQYLNHWRHLGSAYVANGEYQQAISLYTAPDGPAHRVMKPEDRFMCLGAVYREAGDFQSAIETYHHAKDLNSEESETFRRLLAETYEMAGNVEMAKDTYRKLRESSRQRITQSKCARELGRICMAGNQYRLALNEYKCATEVDNGENWLHLAEAASKAEAHDVALEAFEASLSTADYSPKGWESFWRYLSGRRGEEDAREVYQTFMRKHIGTWYWKSIPKPWEER